MQKRKNVYITAGSEHFFHLSGLISAVGVTNINWYDYKPQAKNHPRAYTLQKMGMYRDNVSAIVIGDNLLPIIVIAQNSFDLSITDIAFVTYFVIADKLSR